MLNRVIKARIGEDDVKRLDSCAAKAGLNRSDYLRFLIQGKEIKEAPPVEYFTLICEVRRLADGLERLWSEGFEAGYLSLPSLLRLSREIRQTEEELREKFRIS